MKKTTSAILAVFMLLPIILLCSCSAEAALIGTWTTSTESFLGTVESSYTFKEDGIGTETSMGIDASFTYEVDGDTLKLYYEILGTKTVEEFTFSIDGDKLTLTEGNKATIYTKAE